MLLAKTHIIGIGNGVSYDMIVKGAKEGEGFHTFIYNEQEMNSKVMHIL